MYRNTPHAGRVFHLALSVHPSPNYSQPCASVPRSASAALDIRNGLNEKPGWRGTPQPSQTTLIAWRESMLAAPSGGSADPPLGFLRNNAIDFINGYIVQLQADGPPHLLDGVVPVWLGNDATDMTNALRETRKFTFVNDADHSLFDPGAPSPKVLELRYVALQQGLEQPGSGGLVAALLFLQEQAPMLADRAAACEANALKALARFRKAPRLSASRRTVAKPTKSVQAAAELAAHAASLGLGDATVPLDPAQYDLDSAKKALVGKGGGRLVKVYASEYSDGDDEAPPRLPGQEEEEEAEEEHYVGVISKVAAGAQGAIIVSVAYPGVAAGEEATLEEMNLEVALSHLVPFHEMTQEQLGKLPRSLLECECGADGRKLRGVSGKPAKALGTLLFDALAALERATPGADDRDAADGAGGSPEAVAVTPEAAVDDDPPVGVVSSGSSLRDQLRDLSDGLQQRQIVAIEKYNALHSAACQRRDSAAALLAAVLGPNDGPLNEESCAVLLSAMTNVDALKLRAVASVRDVVNTMRKCATKLLVYKVMDWAARRPVTVARFALSGATSAQRQLQINTFVLNALHAAFDDRCRDSTARTSSGGPIVARVQLLQSDGEACNLKANPYPGAGPSSLLDLAVAAAERVKALRAQHRRDVPALITAVLAETVPNPLPARLQRLGYTLCPRKVPSAVPLAGDGSVPPSPEAREPPTPPTSRHDGSSPLPTSPDDGAGLQVS